MNKYKKLVLAAQNLRREHAKLCRTPQEDYDWGTTVGVELGVERLAKVLAEFKNILANIK